MNCLAHILLLCSARFSHTHDIFTLFLGSNGLRRHVTYLNLLMKLPPTLLRTLSSLYRQQSIHKLVFHFRRHEFILGCAISISTLTILSLLTTIPRSWYWPVVAFILVNLVLFNMTLGIITSTIVQRWMTKHLSVSTAGWQGPNRTGRLSMCYVGETL